MTWRRIVLHHHLVNLRNLSSQIYRCLWHWLPHCTCFSVLPVLFIYLLILIIFFRSTWEQICQAFARQITGVGNLKLKVARQMGVFISHGATRSHKQGIFYRSLFLIGKNISTCNTFKPKIVGLRSVTCDCAKTTHTNLAKLTT